MIRSGSLQYKFLRSFLFLLIPIILFAVVIFTHSMYSTRQYIDEMTLEQFKNAVNDIDSMLNRCQYVVEDTTSLESCFSKEGGRAVAIDSSVFALLEKMTTRLHSDIDVTMYIRGDRYIYTSAEKMVYHAFENQIKSTQPLSGTSFYTTMLSATQSTLFQISSSPGDPEGLVTLMIPVSLKESLGTDMIFTFWIKANTICGVFDSYLGQSRKDIHIYNSSKYRAYFASPGFTVSMDDILKFNGTGLQAVSIGRKSYVLLRAFNSSRGIIFAMVSPSPWFYRTLSQIRMTQVGFLIALVLVIACAAALIARYNYAPIRTLYREVTGAKEKRVKKNELEIIRKYYYASVEEKEELEERISLLNDVVVSQFVEKIVLGRILSEEDFHNQCRYLGISLPYPWYCAMYILPGGSEPADGVLAALQRIAPERADIWTSEFWQESALSAIVNFDCQDAPKDRAGEIALQMSEKLKDGGYPSIRIGVGKAYPQPLKMADSFLEASAVAHFAGKEGKGFCLYENEAAGGAGQGDYQGLTPMRRSLLIEALNRGEKEAALRTINEVTLEITGQANSFTFFRFYSSEILVLLSEQAHKTGVPFDREYLEGLIGYQTSREFMEQVGHAVDRLCSQALHQNQQNDIRVRNNLLEFIQQNYRRYDLTIQDAAEHLSISKAYVASILREYVGQSFSKYIAYLRMNAFKQMLVHTDRTVRELIEEIGYGDIPSFMRKFKAQEGVTPIQYRNMHQPSGKEV